MKKLVRVLEFETLIALTLCILTVTMPIVFTTLQPEVDLIKNEAKQNPIIDSFASILSKTINFIDIIPGVMAEEPPFEPPVIGCCEKTRADTTPPNTPCVFVMQEQCLYPPGQGFYPDMICDNTFKCMSGCCIDRTEGTCSISARMVCESNNGYFTESPDCGISDCEMGCCSLQDRGSYTNRLRCEQVLKGTFQPGVDEKDCVGEFQLQEQGCCTLPTTCTRTIMDNCVNVLHGQFFRDISPLQPTYCSTLSRCSMCTKEYSKNCTNFDVNVHYVDSCGNLEGITLDGNCQNSNTVCVESNGNVRCGGDCIVNGVTRKHGESWCVYDVNPTYYTNPDFKTNNMIPFGVMGSRDFKISCVYGEPIVEPCADYRNQICVQNTSGGISTAGCIMNMWPECLTIKDNETCMANKHCVWDQNAERKLDGNTWEESPSEEDKLKKRDEPFTNYSCLPRYPPGFPFEESAAECEGLEETECRMNSNCLWHLGNCYSALNIVDPALVCNSITYAFKVSHNAFGGCVGNCDAEHLEFAKAMAKKCSALGDCGMTINIMKKTTNDGFIVTKASGSEDEPKYEIITEGETDMDGGAWDWNFLDFSSIKSFIMFPGSTTAYSKFSTPSSMDMLTALKEIDKSMGEFYDIWAEKFEGMGSDYFALGWLLGTISAIGAAWLVTLIPGVGWIVGLIATIALVVIWLFVWWWPWRAAKTWYFIYECKPATQPLGGEDCEKCNEDPYRPCSEYRCKSLGAACILINKGTEEEKCTIMEDNGVPPKIIDAKSLTINYSISPYPIPPGPPGGSFTINGPAANNCFKAWETVRVKIKTDEFSRCGYAFTMNKPFDQMIPIGTGNFNKQHTLSLLFPNQEQGSGQHTLFIKCQDAWGQTFAVDYPVYFCVEVGPDTAAPIIIGTLPRTGSSFPSNVQKLLLSIIINEPAQCRWDRNENTEYKNMALETQCESEPTLSGNQVCYTNLTGFQPDVANLFYIRCNDSAGNVNLQPYQLVLNPSPPLNMTIIYPEPNSIIKGCSLIPKVELRVTTEGGVDNGKAKCYWKNIGVGVTEWTIFTDTDDIEHTTNATVNQNQNTIDVSCRDSWNIVQNSTTFTVIQDDKPPVLTRMYKESGLVIRTDEEATCAFNYRANSCDFAANDTLKAKKFDSSDGMIHTTSWQLPPGINAWYTKCYDTCGNGGKSSDSCIVIYPSDVE